MTYSKRWLILAAGLFSLVGCAHRQLSPGAVRDVKRLAVVVRAKGALKVTVAQDGEQRAFPTLSPREADQQLADRLSKQVKIFELEERVREALMAQLPVEPPWSTALSAAEVATALQSFLVVDRSGEVDYDALRAAGADAVLELQVTEWGLGRTGKVGMYLKGQGKLFHLGGSTIWADSLDTDLRLDPAVEGLDVVVLRDGRFREAVITLVRRLAERIGPQLSGEAKKSAEGA